MIKTLKNELEIKKKLWKNIIGKNNTPIPPESPGRPHKLKRRRDVSEVKEVHYTRKRGHGDRPTQKGVYRSLNEGVE